MKIIQALIFSLLLAAAANAAGNATAGKTVYAQHCNNCHGPTGAGNPKLAQMMHVQIPSLGSAAVQKMTDEQLEAVIKNGKGKMPAMHGLPDKSVDDVVAYVRTFKK